MLAMSFVAIMATMTACKNSEAVQNAMLNPEKQEREFLREAIRHHSPDVQRVDLIGNTVVYTHIFDGIIDMKTYTYDGDVCVEAERVYAFKNKNMEIDRYGSPEIEIIEMQAEQTILSSSITGEDINDWEDM